MTSVEPKVLDDISNHMQSIGLDSVYFQDVPILGITSKLSNLRLATRKGPITCKKGLDFTAVCRKATEESDIYLSDIVFVGFGITAPEYERFDYKTIDV